MSTNNYDLRAKCCRISILRFREGRESFPIGNQERPRGGRRILS